MYKLEKNFCEEFLKLKIMFFLILFFGFPLNSNGLRCYDCLHLSCSSLTICESVKLSMNRMFSLRRHNIQFHPHRICPDVLHSNSSDAKMEKFSSECSKSDSICIHAEIEVLTRFNGLKDSLELDRNSEMKSKGSLRGCANRRFLMRSDNETIGIEAREANDTLGATSVQQIMLKDKYKVQEIIYHQIYIDHGTANAVKCIEDNCNARELKSISNGAYYLTSKSNSISVILTSAILCSHYLSNFNYRSSC